MKLTNIKAIFIDIDGTLTNNVNQVTEHTREAITQITNKGIYVVLCSGRDNKYAQYINKMAHGSQYIISCNGAEIYDCNTQSNIYTNKIDFEKVKKINDYCLDNQITIFFNTTNHKYSKYLSIDLIKDILALKNTEIYEIVTYSDDFYKAEKLEQFIQKEISLHIPNASSNYSLKIKDHHHYAFDITNQGINKGNGITELLKYLGINKNETIGFGNSDNDIALFQSVGFKVAMENASEHLKNEADFITLSNDQDGIAYFIEHYMEYGNN